MPVYTFFFFFAITPSISIGLPYERLLLLFDNARIDVFSPFTRHALRPSDDFVPLTTLLIPYNYIRPCLWPLTTLLRYMSHISLLLFVHIIIDDLLLGIRMSITIHITLYSHFSVSEY